VLVPGEHDESDWEKVFIEKKNNEELASHRRALFAGKNRKV